MPNLLNTPPVVEPISLAEAKAYLRVSHVDEDATISRLIEAARQTVEKHLGLGLLSQSWSVFFDRWPAPGYLPITLAPILAITDVKIYGDDNVAAIIDPAHYYLDRLSRPARLTMRVGRWLPQPGRVLNGIEVVLSVGFGTTAASVPQPLREALLLLLTHYYANRGDAAAFDMPAGIASLLDPFRLVRL
jgi:uncharacterized phiE125 gp8 family phage protein